jgi:hypothetical protein
MAYSRLSMRKIFEGLRLSVPPRLTWYQPQSKYRALNKRRLAQQLNQLTHRFPNRKGGW